MKDKKYTSVFTEARIHPKDDILRGITYEDVMIAVQSNYSEPYEDWMIEETFNDILNINLADAKYDLKKNIKEIMRI